jgi:hypothetical protein
MAKRLGEILLGAGVIDAHQLQAGLTVHKRDGRPLGLTLVFLGYLDEKTLVQTLSKQLSMPMARLRGKSITSDVLRIVAFDLAEELRCLPLFVRSEGGKRVLYLGMEDPSHEEAIRRVREASGLAVKPVLVAPSELEEAFHRLYDVMAGGSDGSTPSLGASSHDDGDESEDDSDSGLTLRDLADAIPKDDAPGPELSDLQRLSNPVFATEDDPKDSEPASVDPTPSAQPLPATSVDNDNILRALTQLLVEKGLITREELVERLGALASKSD